MRARAQVVSTHRSDYQRNYRVTGLTRENCEDIRFVDADGKTTSIVAYFQKTYNYRIRYPKMPCAKVSARGCRCSCRLWSPAYPRLLE